MEDLPTRDRTFERATRSALDPKDIETKWKGESERKKNKKIEKKLPGLHGKDSEL